MLDVPLTYQIVGVPVSKPRMTKADKWKKRDCVLRYRAWADACRRVVTGNESEKIDGEEYAALLVNFYLPIAESYSEKKANELRGSLHTIRPDIDNLLKAVMDSLFLKDSIIPIVIARKFYVAKNDTPRTCLSLWRRKHIRKELLDYNFSVAFWLLRDHIRRD